MKTNPRTNQPFTLFELAEIATRYYDDYRSKQIISGFERCIATDGLHSMFVRPNYIPQQADEVVFYCSVRRGCDARNEVHGTGTMLYRTSTTGPLDPVLNSISTDPEELVKAAHRALNPKFFYRNNRVCYMSRWYVPEDGKIKENFKSRQLNILNRAVAEAGYIISDTITIEVAVEEAIDRLESQLQIKGPEYIYEDDSNAGLNQYRWTDAIGRVFRGNCYLYFSDNPRLNTYYIRSQKGVFVEKHLSEIDSETPRYVKVAQVFDSYANFVAIVKRV